MHLDPVRIAEYDDTNGFSLLMANAATAAVISYAFIPSFSAKVSSYFSKAKTEFNEHAPLLAKKAVNLAGQVLQVASKGAYIGVRTLEELTEEELTDYSDEKGTKLPDTSLTKNYDYLASQDPQFAKCCQLLAEQTSQLYLKSTDKIKHKIYQMRESHPTLGAILDPILFFLGLGNTIESLGWLLDSHQELIVKTIQANILHLVANLIKQSSDPAHPFDDQSFNPLGRLLAVLGSCLEPFEDRLLQIDQMNYADKKQLFKELSQALLAKCFPKGAEDIQLFHSHLPFIGLAKAKLWEFLQEKLPLLLEIVYDMLEPIHLDQADPNWRAHLDERVGVPGAHQVEHLPSFLLQKFVRDDEGALLKRTVEPLLKEQLTGKGIPSAAELSQTVTDYLQSLLLTEDPLLQKMGRFIGQNVMSRLCLNFLKFAPQENNVFVQVLQNWIQGKPAELIVNDIAGQPEQSKELVPLLFQLVGFDQKNNLPFSRPLREMIWPHLQKVQQDILPALISKKLPKWPVFAQRESNKLAIKEWLQDDSLTDTVEEITHVSMEALLKLLLGLYPSLANIMGHFVPLSDEQKQALDAQWQTLLANQNDNLALNQVKKVMWEGLDAFALQILTDLFAEYKEEYELNGPQYLFDQENAQNPSSFAAWLIQKITHAYEKTPFTNITAANLQDFRRAVYLKNAIKQTQDPEEKQVQQAELDQLWVDLKPKFGQLLQQLLTELGYENQTKLPILIPLQPVLWNAMVKFLPKLVFDHAGDVILTLAEKQHDTEVVKALPHGELIQEGCHLLVQDVLKRLPQKLDPLLDALPQNLEPPPLVHLTDRAKKYIGETAKEVAHKTEAAFHPVWQVIHSYLEELVLKIVICLSQMDQAHLEQIKELVKTTKERLAELEKMQESAEKETALQNECQQFTEKLLKWVGIEMEHNLHGIPPAVRPKILKILKEKIAEGLLNAYHIEHHLEHQLAQRFKAVNEVEKELPTSEVALATLALTRRALNQVTQQLSKRVNGQIAAVQGIYQPVKNQLQKLSQQGFETAGWLNQLMTQQVHAPFLEKILNLLNSQTVESYKNQVLEGINPVLTEQVIRILGPLLKKEKEGKAEFDQELLMGVLPILIQHVKHLNQTAQKEGGINLPNFVEVAGQELHPAVQNRTLFYRQQVDLILHIIFPQGKEDLKQLIPDLQLAHDHVDQVWNAVSEKLVEEIPKALDQFIKEETIQTVFISLYENILKSFERPLVKKAGTPEEMNPINPVAQQPHVEAKAKDHIQMKQVKDPHEEERQQQMDGLVGELMIELARFMNLPIDRFENLPNWVKKVMGGNRLERTTAHTIGKAMRKQFNGKLLAKTIQGAVDKLAEKEKILAPIKPPVVAAIEDDVIEPENPVAPVVVHQTHQKAQPSLDDLEKELVEKGLKFNLHLLGERIYEATDVFQHPVFKVIRELTLVIGSFVMTHIVGAFLHLFKLDRWATDYVLTKLKQGREKSIHVLSQPKINEDPIYRSIEALEEVVIK